MQKISHTIRFDIYMAGDLAQAKQVCREYCFIVGFCVHIESCDFIYTGGEEAGFKVGVVNYPRFESDEETLGRRARELADHLRARLCQHSFMIVGPTQTVWVTTREQT